MAYCLQTLNGIARDCDSNSGGIREVFIANYADNVFTVSDGVVTGVSESTNFYQYAFKKETGSMTSTLNADAANGTNYVSTELNLVFSRMDAIKRIEMSALSLGDLVCVVKDANSKYWALGVEEPVTATAATGETGTARSDRNSYNLTLTDYSASYPMPLSEDAVTALMAKVKQPSSI